MRYAQEGDDEQDGEFGDSPGYSREGGGEAQVIGPCWFGIGQVGREDIPYFDGLPLALAILGEEISDS